MAATLVWCERNGATAGTPTENITGIWYKAIDGVNNTPVYTDPTAVIPVNTCSATKYNYGKFTGTGTLSNCKFIHQAGTLTNIQLYCSPTMTVDGDKKAYAQPAATDVTATTCPTDISATSANVTLWMSETGTDATKTASHTISTAGYTNYIVTQLKVGASASSGDMPALTLAIQWDES